MIRTLQAIVVAAAFCLPSQVFAQPPGGPGGMNGRGGPPTEMILQLFTTADADQNGAVTKSELLAVLQNQSRGNQSNQFGRGGPPPMNGNAGANGFGRPGQPPQEEQGGRHGTPPEPGKVLPEPVIQSLNLNERQSRQLATLQAEVSRRLAAILTDEQEAQLQNAGPPQGRPPMEASTTP